jgi:hypothetical protein
MLVQRSTTITVAMFVTRTKFRKSRGAAIKTHRYSTEKLALDIIQPLPFD